MLDSGGLRRQPLSYTQVNKNDANLSKHELAKKKTEEALKKKREALKANKGKPAVEGQAAAGSG